MSKLSYVLLICGSVIVAIVTCFVGNIAVSHSHGELNPLVVIVVAVFNAGGVFWIFRRALNSRENQPRN